RTARRVASNARLLLGKFSAIIVLSKLSMPVLDRATGPDDPTERRAVWLIPSTVPDICCIPEQRPPRRSRRPQPAPGGIGLPTCHAPHDCRRERDRSLCHRRLYCIVHVLWPMMAGRCALPARLSREVRPLSRSVRAVEPLARTAYSPHIRAWPCFFAHLGVPSH